MEAHFTSNELVDRRLGEWEGASHRRAEGTTELVGLASQCLSPSARRRPRMRLVAAELDRILEKEMMLTTVMGDSAAIVTLGIQLGSGTGRVHLDACISTLGTGTGRGGGVRPCGAACRR